EMGTIPVANPSPPRRLGLPRRGLRVAVLMFAIVLVVAVGVGFVWPTGSKVDEPVVQGRISFRLRPQQTCLVQRSAVLAGEARRRAVYRAPLAKSASRLYSALEAGLRIPRNEGLVS